MFKTFKRSKHSNIHAEQKLGILVHYDSKEFNRPIILEKILTIKQALGQLKPNLFSCVSHGLGGMVVNDIMS